MEKLWFPPLQEEDPLITEKIKYSIAFLFSLTLVGLALHFNTLEEIWYGSLKILISPANLVTDYFKLANVGAAFINAALMIIKSLFIIRSTKVALSGPLFAAIFTIAGFSLFGKNLFNSIPIIVGVLLYAKLTRTPFKNYLLSALYGTALGPLVSEVAFNSGFSFSTGIFLGCTAGVIVGLILPPLSRHFASFHKGFSLYNIGFTAGIIGMAFIAFFRAYGIEVDTVYLVSHGYNQPLSIYLYSLFILLFSGGIYLNGGSFSGYSNFLNEDGRGGPDFMERHGLGLTLLNMALLGVLTTTFVLIVRGELNGPVIGGVFTVVGFGAFGKHVKNVFPILLGVLLVGWLTSTELSSTSFLLTALFGTTLAPVSGHYGVIAGILAGSLHMVIVTNISYLHAGMNLYNNGFSGGFTAAIIVPLLEVVFFHKNNRKNKGLIKPIINTEPVEDLEKTKNSPE
ncbi:DUF1576 domain-containing protein [Carnobacterium inhibens]|uniref:Membrane protein n=1 Tax=Carnobacterium inhibens subsp. gilichinskyi TaxID=1266845 RepID=U5S6Z0_9LACT|nr:DUF1576 domain-containing protein [Carnobacterium inhibens]AGY80979.1 membrane protein [Carnobacterium inhibens subsp. gilichinskyi]